MDKNLIKKIQSAGDIIMNVQEKAYRNNVDPAFMLTYDDFKNPIRNNIEAIHRINELAKKGEWDGFLSIGYIGGNNLIYKTPNAAKKYGNKK